MSAGGFGRKLIQRINWIVGADITKNQKVLLMVLAAHDGKNGIFPSWATLMRETDICRSVLAETLTSLEDLGLLSREQRCDGKENRSSMYELHLGSDLSIFDSSPDGVVRRADGGSPPGRTGVVRRADGGSPPGRTDNSLLEQPKVTAYINSEEIDDRRLSSRVQTEPSVGLGEADAQPSITEEKISKRDVDDVLEYWATASYHERRPRITDVRRKRVYLRLKEGFSANELKDAIDGAAKDDWLMGRAPKSTKAYRDVETILRDAAQVERLRDLHNASIAIDHERELVEQQRLKQIAIMEELEKRHSEDAKHSAS